MTTAKWLVVCVTSANLTVVLSVILLRPGRTVIPVQIALGGLVVAVSAILWQWLQKRQ